MTNALKLTAVRALHTAIYLVMAAAVLFILFAGAFKERGVLLVVSLVLIGLETVVFVGNGMRCPLTDVAKRLGAEKGWAFDTFLPERWTRYTFRFFGTLLLVGILLLIFNR